MPASALEITVPEAAFKKSMVTALATGEGLQGLSVRRPTNGIVLKDDTFATIQVIAGNGQALQKLVDAGSRRPNPTEPFTYKGRTATDVYSNFFLQSISETREEKQQIMETFGEPYIFFFGQRARVMQFQGVLLNTWDFNWEAEWWHNYEELLRGTRCVENDARIYLQYDNTLIGGYILGCQSQKQAEQRNFVSFGFTLFVTDYVSLSNPLLGDSGSRGLDSLFGKDEIDVSSLAIQEQMPTLLTDGFDDSRVTIGPDGKVVSGTLDTTNAPRTLAEAWRKTVAATNQFFDTVGQVANGTVVRVPAGFEGSLAFDEKELTTLRPIVTSTRTIAYSTFQQNDEEYIRVGDHYLSSHAKTSFGATDPDQFTAFDWLSARVFWLEQGVTPDSSLLVALSEVAQGVRLGLIAVNVGQALTTYRPAPSAPNLAAPFRARAIGAAILE